MFRIVTKIFFYAFYENLFWRKVEKSELVEKLEEKKNFATSFSKKAKTVPKIKKNIGQFELKVNYCQY
jgi:hypothetical protein